MKALVIITLCGGNSSYVYIIEVMSAFPAL